jgi:hypothetical protein
MPGFKCIWLALLTLLAAPASAVTPEQAQTLPVAELARLVLGEAGVLVEDVDRPKWRTCGVGCPPLTEEQMKGWPNLDRLTFYTRPGVGWSSEKWRGLCVVQVISVPFGARGEVAGIAVGRSWAAPFGMERVTTKATQSDIAAEDEKCRSGGDPRTFFQGDDVVGLTAFRVLVAARLFAEAVERGGRLPFKFECKSDFSECEEGAAESVSARFWPATIASAEQVDCADRQQKLSSVGPDACYRVSLKRDGESLFLEIADGFSDIRIKRLEYSRGMVIVD